MNKLGQLIFLSLLNITINYFSNETFYEKIVFNSFRIDFCLHHES